jgi:Uma2 family endonuclease
VLKDSTKLMTAGEFQDWLAGPTAPDRDFELVCGKLIEKRVEGRLHGLVCANVGCMLGDFTRRRQRGLVCINNCGVFVQRNPDTVIGPDILLFDDHLATWDQLANAWCEDPPRLPLKFCHRTMPLKRWIDAWHTCCILAHG